MKNASHIFVKSYQFKWTSKVSINLLFHNASCKLLQVNFRWVYENVVSLSWNLSFAWNTNWRKLQRVQYQKHNYKAFKWNGSWVQLSRSRSQPQVEDRRVSAFSMLAIPWREYHIPVGMMRKRERKRERERG